MHKAGSKIWKGIRLRFFVLMILAEVYLAGLPVSAEGTVSGNNISAFGENQASGQDISGFEEIQELGNSISGPEENQGPSIPKETQETGKVPERLRVDAANLYEGMDHTYGQGYIPRTDGERVYVVLPLIGSTYEQTVTATVDLGSAKDSPFVFGNFSQTIYDQEGVYVFRFEIPLSKDRVNGSYPVTIKTDYLDTEGNTVQQNFLVYVTIADGSDPDAPEIVSVPQLFVGACEIAPNIVGAGEEFTVTLTIENIGAVQARSVLLSYGSEEEGVLPVQANNVIHLENISGGSSATASFMMKVTGDALSGDRSFFVKLDYGDLYGGNYEKNSTFLIHVTQPPEIMCDPVLAPGEVVSGETFSMPINVFNTGKSTLKNVMVTASGEGLFPYVTLFLGDIRPGQQGGGEMELYVGTRSMSNISLEDYGETSGVCTVTYTDEGGEEHHTELPFATKIVPPASAEAEDGEEQRTALQWWVSVLVVFAIISVMIAGIVVTRFSRMYVLTMRQNRQQYS